MKTFLKRLLICTTLLVPSISYSAPSNLQLWSQQQWNMLEQQSKEQDQMFENLRMRSRIDDLERQQRAAKDQQDMEWLLYMLRNHPELFKGAK